MAKLSAKDKLRISIKARKKEHTHEELKALSQEVITLMEMTQQFADAKCILAYCSMKDEVDTIDFIERHCENKKILLPVVDGDNLILKHFEGMEKMKKSHMGMLEPQGDIFDDHKSIDLIIVPGMAFDRHLSRLGRGRGFYDKLLEKSDAIKMGLCFDFQLMDSIPSADHDIKMDVIVAENEIVW